MTLLRLLVVFLFALCSNANPAAPAVPQQPAQSDVTRKQPILTNEDIQNLIDHPEISTTELKMVRTDYNDLVKFHQKSLSNAQPGYIYDFLLSFPFNVGEPANFYFNLHFESAVSKLFVFDKSYGDPQRDPQRPTYDPDNSETSVPKPEPFSTITAGNIVAKGKTYGESVRFFAPDDPFEQLIGSVTDFNFTAYPFDGVFGIGWDPAVKKHVPGPEASPIVNLLEVFDVDKQQFSMILGSSFSVISWGTAFPVDPVKVHNHNGVPAVLLDSYKFHSFEDHTKIPAVLDTGYSTIALPEALYRQVILTTDPRQDPNTGLLVVKCGDQTRREPKFIFTIGGVQHVVRQLHYVIDRDFPNEVCILAVSKSPDNAIHLGMPFLLTVGVTYNLEDNEIRVISRIAPPN